MLFPLVSFPSREGPCYLCSSCLSDARSKPLSFVSRRSLYAQGRMATETLILVSLLFKISICLLLRICALPVC